ncbi:hypothetical protein [Mycolicibacter virginiensis]|uniref:hypothetical protein n=1 Tax=Mycolicibacter virginiensis TaxID=1795032 RepID=UPI001F03D351|nr:hypothetical protein [Mycolicibacter virginiensis]ULP48039.1 hypothetical protein MJO54_02385 [Mycolicibacter virginiensis]
MTTTETSEPLTRSEKAAVLAGVGFVALLVGQLAGITQLTLAGGVAVAVGAAMGMSAGWFVGLTPRPAAAPATLVGVRIGFAGGVYTVIDDSAPSVTVAQRHGGRCTVMATDAAGRGVQLLFLELDRAGHVTAAATEECDWGVAGAVGV